MSLDLQNLALFKQIGGRVVTSKVFMLIHLTTENLNVQANYTNINTLMHHQEKKHVYGIH